jgi:hypothetical protein
MLLQRSSRGEEACKKLLAVGLAHSAKPRRPQGPSSKAGLQPGVARARSFRRDLSSCCSPLTHIAGLTFQGTGAKVVRVAAARAAPAAADRAQPALCPAGTLACQADSPSLRRVRRAHACAALATARRQLTQRTGSSAHRAPAAQHPYHLMLLPPLPACLSLQVPRVVPPRRNSLPSSFSLSPPHFVCCRAACKLQHCSRAPHVRRRVGNNRDVARVQRRPGHGAPPFRCRSSACIPWPEPVSRQ